MSAVPSWGSALQRWWSVPHRRWLGFVVLVAFALRAGWGLSVLVALPEMFEGGDQYGYVRYGREIAAGDGYVSYTTGTPTAYYPVGYPALLAGLFWLLAHTPLPDELPAAVAVLHAVLGAATVGFVWLLARRALGPVAGWVAAVVVAVHPDLIAYGSSYALETAFVAFALGALAVLAGHDWASGPPSSRRLLAFGLALGVAGLIRPFALPFLLALAGAVAATGVGWRRCVRAVAVAGVAAVLVLTPWTVRNAVRLDAFVPISTNLGDTACMSRFVGSEGGFAWAAHEWCADPTLPDVERSAENLRLAAEFVRTHPAEELALVGRRFTKMFGHGHSGLDEAEASGRGPLPEDVRRVAEGLSDAWFAFVLALGVPGVLLTLRRWREAPARALVAIPALVLLVIPLGLWGAPRFAMPLAPFLAVGVGATASAVAAAVGRRRLPLGPAPGPGPLAAGAG
ncbi:MAG: glycosyltransferase family 39 protein [Acidimicrobiia bacterium]